MVSNAQPLRTERVSLTETLGRILAENIHSDLNLPPFNKSAVDGFAVKMEDLSLDLRVIELIPAGKIPEKTIRKGQCARIMTGAIVPEGADGVIMVENTIELGNGNIRFTGESPNRNICYLGEDVKEGDLVLSQGIEIQPQHIAVLASVGATNPMVFARAEVGLLSTGNELVEPAHIPSPSQIRNSNASQIFSQLIRCGAIAHYKGIALDNEVTLTKMIRSSLDQFDILILTGGVSMGDYDYVPAVLENLGFRILFRSVAIQPGKPTLFGRNGNQFVFGLPGNPVSSFTVFELLVRPFLRKIMGDNLPPVNLLLPMGTNYQKKKSARKSIFPVRIDQGKVFPVEYHGSAHINAYTNASGICFMEPDETLLVEGKLVHVRQL